MVEGLLVSVIAGLVFQVVWYVALGIDIDDVPVLVIIIVLWSVFSTLAAVVVDKIGL